MNYFVSVTKHEGKPAVKVDGRGGNIRYFPLTIKGCKAAGAWLYAEKQESWMCSSSVDFPNEVKRGCHYDVRTLMSEGYAACVPPPAIRTERVGDYAVCGNQHVAIAINVNNPADSHYFTIDPDVNNDAFVRACGWAHEPATLPKRKSVRRTKQKE